MKNSDEKSKKIKEKAQIIGNQLRCIGYRGICGFDFIIINDMEILLIEVNPRYQGSSYVINNVLISKGFLSLFELNTLCFQGNLSQTIINDLNKLNIQYENHVVKESSQKEIIPSNANIYYDGYELAKTLEKGVYLYRYII